MVRESVLFGGSVVVVILGLAVLLYGEAIGPSSLVYVGGIIALIATGVLAFGLDRLEGPEGH